jgi:hypothetical protein
VCLLSYQVQNYIKIAISATPARLKKPVAADVDLSLEKMICSIKQLGSLVRKRLKDQCIAADTLKPAIKNIYRHQDIEVQAWRTESVTNGPGNRFNFLKTDGLSLFTSAVCRS